MGGEESVNGVFEIRVYERLGARFSDRLVPVSAAAEPDDSGAVKVCSLGSGKRWVIEGRKAEALAHFAGNCRY